MGFNLFSIKKKRIVGFNFFFLKNFQLRKNMFKNLVFCAKIILFKK